VTLPLIGALERTTPAEEKAIRAFFTLADPQDDDIARVIEIVAERGGSSYARERAARYADLASSALDEVAEGPAAAALRDAIVYAVDRRR
jgi:geranylgeranyl pyrophosphate synthase